jgi:predicted permease
MSSLFAFLLRLFPAAFRKQFGAEMLEQIRGDYERAWSRGRVIVLGFTIVTAWDLVRSAVAERLHPSWASDATANARREEKNGMIDGWTRDIRHAVRGLRRSPGFAVIAIGTLGLAIGANAGIFSVVNAVLLNPLPYADADRLVHITASAPGSDMPPEFGVSAEFFIEYNEQSELLEDVSMYDSGTSTLRVGDRTERVPMAWVTTSFFSTLHATPVVGRLPVPEDDNRVALISHGLWTTWFGADPSVIGRTYFIGGSDRTVIGVMGPAFRFPHDGVLVWIPGETRAGAITPGRFGQPLVARMTPGARLEDVAAELQRLALRLPERFGGSASYARLIEQHRPVVRPLEKEIVGDVSGPLWVLLGSVGIVLVIACANVANLFMVRAERRQRDLAVRRAIGAARSQLFRLEMVEAVVVATLAGALALVLAWVSVPAVLGAAPPDIPRIGDVSMSASTLLFTSVVSLLAALLCGLVPALRSSAPNLMRLRDGGRGSTQRRHWRRDGLVVAQTALALVLLIGSGLLIRSFITLRNVDPGYDTNDVFTFQIAPDGVDWDAMRFAQFHLDFMHRVAALPGVESVGIIENVPLNESVDDGRFRTTESRSARDGGTLLGYTFAAGDYFRTMGIEVLAGRAFTKEDHISSFGNIMISRSAANLLWPGENPIGRRLQVAQLESWETVVGVVEDVMQNSFRDTPQPLVYFPLVGQSPNSWLISSPAYVVKTRRAETIASEIRALVREVAPTAPMYRMFTMEGLASDSIVQLSFTMLTLGIMSALALLLGTIGLYGVLSNVVAERTREIGVRMALGAEAKDVRRMVVAQGARVIILGISIGLLVAFATTRALRSLLFGVGAVDVVTFVATSGAMIVVGLLASYLPARRASNVDPILSLRTG